MKNLITLFAFFISAISISLSQSIFSNPITGTNPSSSNPYITGQTVNANITVSGIGRGTGITGNTGADRYNAKDWNTPSIDLTAYFEFILTPNFGYSINLSSFVYNGQATGTGPTAFAFRSSLDSYIANIGNPTSDGATISLSTSTYQGITSAITFRLYGWGASGGGGTFSVNDFIFNGTVSSSCTSPNNQATSFSPSNIQSNQMDINWVRGTPSGGDNVLVVARASGAVNADPSNGTSYTANAAFGSGETIGAGNYVVYKGSGTNVTVTALTAGTTYHYAIYEFNNTGYCYNQTQLTGNATTLASGSEIQLEYPVSTNVSCGVSVPFGSVTLGANSSRTVRIRNSGGANLVLNPLPLTISGANPGDYSITTQPASPIAAGGYSDVIIQFTPTSAGTRTATISIANNDSDENPCSILLTGTGLLANDDCSGAIPLTVYATPTCGGATSGTTVGATSSGLSPIVCSGFNGTADDDVWYSFVATSDRHTITVVGATPLDAVVDLRSGTCNGTNITCVDATTSGGTEVINATGLTIGATYLIRIYGYDSGNGYGAFTVCVTTPTPEIQLKESGTIDRACGFVYNMGTVNVGSTASLTVRIQNTATNGVPLNLTNLPLTITGADASEFSIISQPSSPIAANNAFSEVVIEFAPSSNGAKTAAISIGNNDSDENPCSINLSGTGQVLYFQTRQSGDWSNAATWEVSSSAIGPWSNATAAPTVNDMNINITAPHVITISSGTVTIDQLTVASNSMLDITGGILSITDGTGVDMTVFGILKNAGTINTNGTIVIENGGIYQHNYTSTYGTIPTATWNAGSTCEIIGYTIPSADGFPAGSSQAFSNFSWNTTNLSTAPNLNGGTINASGTFYLVSTGTSELRLGTSSNGTIHTNEFSQQDGTINCAAGSGTGTIRVSGNFEQTGGTITESGSGSGIIEFMGASNITAIGTIENTINFLINSPSNTLSLLSNLSLTSPTTLTLNAGKLNLNGFELQADNISGPLAWGNTATNYIIAETGNLRRTLGTNTLFPVGTATQYMPCRLTGTGDFKVNISTTLDGLSNPSLALAKQWNITFGNGVLGMSFQWPNNTFGTSAHLFKHNGTSWANVAGPVTATGSGTDPYIAAFGAIDCCSGFTVGALGALPVELAFFKVKPDLDKVILDWRTYSETNNAFFSIEKSSDGKVYSALGSVEGKGFSTEINDYDFVDESPNAGINYYRLKQVDFDGNFEYSKVVSVFFGGGKGNIQLYPTLASNEIHFRFPAPTETEGIIQIYDLSGRLVMEKEFETEIEDLTLKIEALINGQYFVRVQNGPLIETLRFLRQ